MNKIYISGRITGLMLYDLYFEHAEEEIKAGLSSPLEIVNPCKLPQPQEKTWEGYMKQDINALLGCDAIFMLRGWWRSKGARLEHRISKALGMAIIYE